MKALAVLLLWASPLSAAEIVFEGGGERLAIEGKDLAEVAPYFLQDQHAIIFRLNVQDGEAFSDMTGRLIGQVLSMSICETLLAEPVVRDQLSGAGIVPMPDAETAVAYTAALKGEAPCP